MSGTRLGRKWNGFGWRPDRLDVPRLRWCGVGLGRAPGIRVHDPSERVDATPGAALPFVLDLATPEWIGRVVGAARHDGF